LFENRFIKHPNEKVYSVVKNLFNEALRENFILKEEMEEAIRKGYLSEKIIN